MEYLVILILVVLAIYFILRKKSNNGSEAQEFKIPYDFKKKQYFMTRSENEFYQKLVSLFGNKYYIFSQVSIASILSEKIKGQNWKAARNIINRKSVDYLICNKDYINPLVAIELDDPSHERKDRVDRDVEVEAIFAKAGMPLVRFSDINSINNDDNIYQKIEDKINRKNI